MKKEAQRIAIAEACGWREIKDKSHFHPEGFHPTRPRGSERLPDYLNDLNAMRDAEATLTQEQQKEYANRIVELCQPYLNGPAPALFAPIHATAAQRAEAFLKTIGHPHAQ